MNSDLPDNYVLTLHLDSTQSLWAGTETGGLAKYDHINGMIETNELNIWAYPTVADQFLIIEAPSLKGNATYVILDELGRVVQKGSLTSPISTLNVNALGSGSYFVRVWDKESVGILRFQRQKQ